MSVNYSEVVVVILLTYEAEAENVTSDMIIDKILALVPVP